MMHLHIVLTTKIPRLSVRTHIHIYTYIHTCIHCTYIRIVYLVREPFLQNGGVSMVIKLNGDAIGDKTADFCLRLTLDAGEGRMCGWRR